MNIKQNTKCAISAASIAVTASLALSACVGQQPAFGLDQMAVASFDEPRSQRFEPYRDLAERRIGMEPPKAVSSEYRDLAERRIGMQLPKAVSSEYRDLAERRIWIDTEGVVPEERYVPGRRVSDR